MVVDTGGVALKSQKYQIIFSCGSWMSQYFLVL